LAPRKHLMLISSFFLIMILLREKDKRSPLAIFCIAWLVSLAPSILGVITYNFFPSDSQNFSAVFLCYNVLFVVGYKIALAPPLRRRLFVDPIGFRKGWEREFADFAALLSLCGAILLIIDLRYFQGIAITNLDALAQVRQSFAERQANWLTQFGSLMTWGALYVLAYLIVQQSRLLLWRKVAYALPVAGVAYTGLLSAGRQVAFQLLSITVLALVYRGMLDKKLWRMSLRWRAFAGFIVLGSVLYMGMIAHKRADSQAVLSKADVLANLFDFSLNPNVERSLDRLGPAVKDGVVEGLVYFSSPVNMFAVFLSIPKTRQYLGVVTFPLLARRLEFLTGLNVTSVMEANSRMLSDAGVMGVAWSTSYASFILDFGIVGAGLLLLTVGFLSGKAWQIFLRERSFSAVMLLVSACLAIVYMPLIPSISDTNILMLTLASALVWSRSHLPSYRLATPASHNAARSALQRSI
jgi:hypothetical protein